MSKVIYDGKECEVISVKTEWDYGIYNSKSRRMPNDTWLLINCNGYLIWVNMSDCKGI